MLVSLGLDFRRARLEVRERFLLEQEDGPRIFAALEQRGVEELVLTRTCNRVEAYCWWPQPDDAQHESQGRALARHIAHAWVGGDAAQTELLLANARLRRATEAARHLLRVAAGLESQILGDMHILGQLRRTFADATDARSLGTHLHRLFETALRVGKQVKRETHLMATRNGVGSEAARRAAGWWSGLAGRRCVVIGCGKSGTHAARCLHEQGAELTVLNRTLHRAEKLARDLGGVRAAGLDALSGALSGAEVVVVATGAAQPVLTASQLTRAREGQRPEDAALLVIDVSVPRNVQPTVGAMAGVELVDLDTLHPEAAEVEKSRLAAVPHAESLVEAGVCEYESWLELGTARRALSPLQQVLSEICRRELSHLAGESASARRTADRIVARVMAHPMTALRAATSRGESVEEAADALGELFANRGSA